MTGQPQQQQPKKKKPQPKASAAPANTTHEQKSTLEVSTPPPLQPRSKEEGSNGTGKKKKKEESAPSSTAAAAAASTSSTTPIPAKSNATSPKSSFPPSASTTTPSTASSLCPPPVIGKVFDDAVPLRPYQRRIAEQAIGARSSVVLLPTGAGKTNVAAAFLRHFFMSDEGAGEGGGGTGPRRRQAIFVVPTIPLLSQQIAALRPYIPADIPILRIQGGKAITLANPTTQALYVGVPEATRRLLLDKKRGPSEGALIDHVGALVLDEVHHAHNAHPYKKILAIVAAEIGGGDCKEKNANNQGGGINAAADGKTSSSSPSPRSDIVAILGLTASLCHARTLSDVRKRIATLLVMLGVAPNAVFSASSEEIDNDGCVLPPPPTEIGFDTTSLNFVTLQPQTPLLSMARAVQRGDATVLPFTAALFKAVMAFEAVLGDFFDGGVSGKTTFSSSFSASSLRRSVKDKFPMAITETWRDGRNVAASLLSKDLASFITLMENCSSSSSSSSDDYTAANAAADCRALCRLMDALKLIAVSAQLGADTAWYYLSHYPHVRSDLENAAVSPKLAALVASVFAAGESSFALETIDIDVHDNNVKKNSSTAGGSNTQPKKNAVAAAAAVSDGARGLIGAAVPARFAILADLVWEHCLQPSAVSTASADQRRAIVFVRERVSANIIADFINTTFGMAIGNGGADGGKKKSQKQQQQQQQPPAATTAIARAFVSTGGDAPSPLIPKLSSSEADAILEAFNNGNVRILVATTVAEEGLDVQRCAAIIHFERPSNPVAYAQRTGRARAANSAAIVLDGTVHEHQMALVYQRQVVEDTASLAAAMAVAAGNRAAAIVQQQLHPNCGADANKNNPNKLNKKKVAAAGDNAPSQ